ncbi:MAG: kelch repeat-containing protein, partial [Elusimicrobiota bacterium]
MRSSFRPLSLLAALGMAMAALCVPAEKSFGQAYTPRRSHTHTLMPDGNIIAVGGIGDENPGLTYLGSGASGVQRLNENLGIIENLPAMSVDRASHTATLLPDGRILVAGGFSAGCGGTCGTYTIFDPLSSAWSAPAALPSGGRYNHTASLTKDGRVFICGGQNGGAVLSSCDVFTPGYGAADAIAAGAAGQNLLTGRTGHTASIVFNGDIFVTGGWNSAVNPPFIPFSERFSVDCNPPTGCWGPAAPLWEGRAYHTATTMANGHVMIAGGNNGKNTEANRGFLNTSEIYDPSANRMTVGPNLTSRKASFAAALRNNGSVVIQGGLGNIPTTYFTPSATINEGAFFTGPGAAGCTNPAGALPFCDLGDTISSATVITSNISVEMLFQLGSQVTGIVREGEILFENPVIEWVGGSSRYASGQGDEYDGYSGTYGSYAGANVFCNDVGTCGWAYLANLALFMGTGNYGNARFNPSVPADYMDATSCIDFTAATISNMSTPSPIRYGNPAPFPAGDSRCAGGRNYWNGPIMLTGFPLATIGGVISSGTVLLEAVTGEKVDAAAEATYTINISSMFAEIPAGTAIFQTLVGGEPTGAISFSANFRDITGVVGVDTDLPQTGPILNNITLEIPGATVKYVASRIDLSPSVSAGTFVTGPLPSVAITRNMIFADFDEYDGNNDTWQRIPLDT